MQQTDGYCATYMPIANSTAESQQVVRILTVSNG
jgi:hypothetical protein